MNTVQTGIMIATSVPPPHEASISSSESMGTPASHDDDDEDTEDESSSENSSDEENDPCMDCIDQRGSVQGVGSVQRDLARSFHGGS